MSGIVEVIRDGEIVRVSEEQAIEDDLFILRKLIEPEKEPYAPSEVSASSVRTSWKEEHGIDPSHSRLQSWKAGKFSYKKNRVVDDLVENFHWEIARGRRKKDITRKELAEAVGVPEEEIKMIEFGELPRDDFILVNKIEDYLGINLRKEKKQEGPTLSDLQEMDEKKIRREIEKAGMDEADNRGVRDVSGTDIEIVE